jgi:hypothetical protein
MTPMILWRRRAARLAAVLTTILGVACGNEQTIRSDPLTLTPGEWNVIGSTSIRVEGPQSEVCATIPQQYEFADTGWYLVSPSSNRIALRARLVTDFGASVDSLSLGFRTGAEKRICFRSFDRPIGERYREVQFMATDSLLLRDIRWWSGKRTKFF